MIPVILLLSIVPELAGALSYSSTWATYPYTTASRTSREYSVSWLFTAIFRHDHLFYF